MKKWIKNLAFLIVLLVGCNPIITSTQSNKNTPTSIPLTPTATFIPPTESLDSKEGKTPNPTSCFETIDTSPTDKWGEGIVVLESRKIEQNGRIAPGFFFLNMKDKKLQDLNTTKEIFQRAFVSPDATKLSADMITITDENKVENVELVIMNQDGSVETKIPAIEGATSGAGWLDNQHLLINMAGLDPDENSGIKPSTLLLMNYLTGEQQYLRPAFPNMYNSSPLPYWGEPLGRSLSVYSPSFTKVVYLGEDGYTYVLWDVEQNMEITRLLHWNVSSNEQPRWSPDGSKFVMSAFTGDKSLWPQPADGLYLVDTEGNITKLMETDSNMFIWDHYWSPSGRYIAVLQSLPNSEIQKKRLFVVDTLTSQITDTCVEYQSLMENDTPIWSPDESQILLYQNLQNASNVILVDLTKKIAFPIEKDMEPKGWMK